MAISKHDGIGERKDEYVVGEYGKFSTVSSDTKANLFMYCTTSLIKPGSKHS